MTNALAPFFNAQFFDDLVTPIVPLAGGKLYTYISGTVTNQLTYQDSGTTAPNTNPITLDSSGRCNLWLLPTAAYTFKITRADGTLIKTFDNVGGSALVTGIVTSVNGSTGAVSLTAPNIPFTTGTSTTWFVGTDVGAALDSIITHVDSAIPAASIPVADAGNYFTTPKNVENVLQQLGARTNHGALLRITPFIASGTWTKGSDVNFVVVQGVGGGGGSTTQLNGGGGGGGGGYFEKIVTTPGATEAVAIGIGGTAGSAGGSTSFGTWATATGGAPGASSGTSTAGGGGGNATGGTLNLPGNGGGSGGATSANFIFGQGGGSFWGGGAQGQWNGGTGTAGATNTGGGGSGGTSGGSSGGSGLVLVYEYS